CGDCAAIRPAWSRTCTSAPVRAARSSTGFKSAAAQELVRSHAAPEATVTALVRLERCRLVRSATSAAVNAAARPASSATPPSGAPPASATPTKASASRRPSVSLRLPGGRGLASAIAGQPQAVAAAQDRLHDPRIAGIVLDLAAQVLHVRVHGALIPFELVATDPVDQLEPRVHPAGHRGQCQQQAPFGGGEVNGRAAYHDRPPRLVDDQLVVAVAGHPLLRRRAAAAPQDRLNAEHQLPRAER